MSINSRAPSIALLFCLYACLYAAFGVASPFWPRYFEARGVSAHELGILFAAGTFIRLFSGPLAGRFADLTQSLPGVLALTLCTSAILAIVLIGASGFWVLCLIYLAQSAALAPSTSLADALSLSAAASLHFEYGRLRGSASAAFVSGTVCAGFLIATTDISIIVWIHAAMLIAASATVVLVRQASNVATPSQSGPRVSFSLGLPQLWAVEPLRPVILVSALVYGSHALHDSFAMIRWNAAGIPPALTGLLWAEAVLAEVLMFILLGPFLLRQLGPRGAAALAAAAGVVRWVAMASSTSITVVALTQPLHGFTFALMHLACMQVMSVAVPQRLAASAQSAYGLGSGVMSMFLTGLSGYLYSAYGGEAYFLMALLCALAVAVSWRSFGANQPSTTIGVGW